MGECAAQAADYPERPVKIIVPFPPGGAVDLIARVVAENLSAGLGGKFYVENLPGAGGDLGTRAAAAAPADGYTLEFVAPDFVVSPLVKTTVPFDPVMSFAPISLVASAQELVLVNPSVPARDMKELIALLKANPGKYNFATPGYGTLPDLEGTRLFALSHGLNVVHVPFQGMAPAVQATLAGQTSIIFCPIALAAPYLENGSLRALATESGKRSARFPDVPTLGEAGNPNHESEFVSGLLAPVNTPKPIIDQLQRQIARAMALPEVKERLAKIGFDPVASTPDEFGAWIKAETAKWAPVTRQANIKID
jgi:tripartite-type tricarboxylate transporter receptor subunit TctC